MDARKLKSRFFNERCLLALLGIVVVTGLWQGYGDWLLAGNRVG